MPLRDEKARAAIPGEGRAAAGGPSQQAGPVFRVLPGNLPPRGAGSCGSSISSRDGEAEPSAQPAGVPAQLVSTWGRGTGVLVLGELRF